MPDFPLVIEFAAPSSLLREASRPSSLPIIGNGPPGTFVVFPRGLRVSLPTDQIVFAEETDGRVRVAFGGMRFAGDDQGQLLFRRERELYPEEQLSPARSHVMRLDPLSVHAIAVDGESVWPHESEAPAPAPSP